MDVCALNCYLVRVEVYPASLTGCTLNEFHTLVEFAKLVVGATTIGDNFYSIECQLNVRGEGGKKLLASFARQAGVAKLEKGVSKGHVSLPCATGTER